MSWYNIFVSNIQYLFSMRAEDVWNLRHYYVQVFVAIEIYNLGRLLRGVEVSSKFKILMLDGIVLSNVVPMW